MALKSGANMPPMEPVFTTKIIVVMNGLLKTMNREEYADKDKIR